MTDRLTTALAFLDLGFLRWRDLALAMLLLGLSILPCLLVSGKGGLRLAFRGGEGGPGAHRGLPGVLCLWMDGRAA
jgi:hypothetical protein